MSRDQCPKGEVTGGWRVFRSRPFWFRVGAVLFGLSIVALLEGGLRLTNLGRPEDVGDPYVGFSEVHPLFVLDSTGERYAIPVPRQVFFQPDSFAAQKGQREFRIFCLGGSTVQGRPYSIETSFTTWLELTLKAADPSRDWEVVNCGGVSYASYRLIPIMQEILAYEPDLLIVYTGQNEFLEERTYDAIKRRPRWMKSLHEKLLRLRLYGVARKIVKTPTPTPVDMSAEVDALLDYQGGLAKYHRDDAWKLGVVEHYEHNLRRMVRIAQGADVPMILANPVSNIRDSAPFKVELASELTTAAQQEFQKLWEEAKLADWDNQEEKLAAVQRVLALDSRYADAQFLLGRVYESMKEPSKAKLAYLRAKDEDICPLRMLESMHSIVSHVAAQTETPLVDIRALFEAEAELGIPGDRQLIDHVHPRIEGHQKIALAFFEELQRLDLAHAQTGWQERQRELYRLNYDGLPDNYFPESVERLRGLQRWSQGRATKLGINPE